RDDPRWRGAARRDIVGGTESQGTLRALYADEGDTRYLYLSFDVNFDPSLDIGTDQLAIALRPASSEDGDTEYLIHVQPLTNSDEKTGEVVLSKFLSTRPYGGTSWTSTPEPAWLNAFMRHWVETTGVDAHSWTVQLRIPITGPDSLDVSTDLELYAALVVRTPGGYIQHVWPRDAPDINAFGIPSIPNGLPDASTWGPVFVDAFLPNEDVCSAGVSLAWNQIGTTNADPHTINLTGPNTFFAAPYNGTADVIPDGTIGARFRLANWGAAMPSDQWTEIAFVTSTIDIPADSNTPAGALQATYTVSDTDRPTYEAHPHQCILVELSSTINLDFANDSVVRNMDFVEASTFERDAEISTVGLGDPPGGNTEHDLWIFVEERNLPVATWADRIGKSFVALTRLGGGPREGQDRFVGNEFYGWRPGWEGNGVAPDVLSREESWPTYRIHVYRETGEFFDMGDGQLPNLKLVGSYGYYLQHEGSLVGWQTQFEGAEQISPHLYRLSLGKDAVAQVSNTIVAEEVSTLWALGILLLLLLIIILSIFFLRRRRPVSS
ncbi:MAG TPA: hypothetical protein P5121_30255, partial [Caldilineaceae bacterium]|nr:hypothetical protein [Caldilineaceae bacterium]